MALYKLRREANGDWLISGCVLAKLDGTEIPPGTLVCPRPLIQAFASVFFLRIASVLSRSALSLMKPEASW